jgi:nitronate monooxygenase/enoyl-[acyl-carrier protein] reductase II
MLHTPICDLLGIEWPIIQAGMGPFTSAELVAEVSNAGALGSLSAGGRTAQSLREHLARTGELTDRPFAVNFTLSAVPPDPEAFTLALAAKPRLISFALGDPDEFVKRAHDAGALVMHMVTTRQQAYRAAECGVDIIIAQGSEAGGFGGPVAGLVLIPQVVDAVRPVPVIAAGGIADGRGLAAALVLGAQGANIGTRFLASTEAPISESWKQAILAAESQDAIQAEFWSDIFPTSGLAYSTTPRALRSPFIDEWQNRRDMAKQEAERLRGEVGAAVAQGRLGELFPFTGQTAGLIKDVLPAAEIVHRLVAEAEETLQQTAHIASIR